MGSPSHMGSNATTLSIEERILARSEEGALQAEYALFKPRDARGNDAPSGETSYQTTAGEARARLESAGVNLGLAEEAAAALRPEVVDAYALADAVRSLAARLGPCELFEGNTYDAPAQVYDGAWLDLRALAKDLNVPGAGLALQALHLAAAVAECDPEARIVLSIEHEGSQRGAERAFQRVPSDYVRRLLGALRALRSGERRARAENGEDVRNDLARRLRDRALSKPTEPARRRIEELEHALAAIDVPSRGPLASVDLWALERQLAANDARGVEEKLDAIERSRGKTPATRYLREHAAFVRGSDPPRRIAERLSHWMRPGAPFYELDLLKARAWLAAGMPGYARHYARGLVEDRSAPDGVCLVALEILEVTSTRSRTMPPPPVGSPSTAPQSVRSAPIVMLGPRGSQPAREEVVGRGSSPPQEEIQRRGSSPAPEEIARRGSSPAREEVWRRSAPPPEEIVTRGSVVPEPPVGRGSHPSWPPEGEVIPRRPSSPPREEVRIVPRPGSSPPREETLARTMPLTRPIAHLPAVTQAIPRGARPAFLDHPPETERMAEPFPQAPPQAPTRPPPQLQAPQPNAQHHLAERGFVTDNPPPNARSSGPAQGSMPPRRGERYVPENAETLPLPAGLTEDMLAGGVIPRTPDEVRIACTRMSRELARDYRLWYGSRIQISAIAIETMQRHLLTRWPNGVVPGDDSTFELRRHGALLSEILARALGGHWVDVSPSEVGYWAMFVPPATRTWPFGRVVRFVTMGHREKDLVSYYLELASRARTQR